MGAQRFPHHGIDRGPCGVCDATRTEALRPLVENPALKCWTQLVLDMDTAEELVGGQ